MNQSHSTVDRLSHALGAAPRKPAAPRTRIRTVRTAALQTRPAKQQPQQGTDDVHQIVAGTLADVALLGVANVNDLSTLRVVLRLLRRLLNEIDAAAAGQAMLEHVPQPIPRRQGQVLDGLRAGLAEKQIARQLGISKHTVHVHVKCLYRRFGVASRSELLSLWVMADEEHAPANKARSQPSTPGNVDAQPGQRDARPQRRSQGGIAGETCR